MWRLPRRGRPLVQATHDELLLPPYVSVDVQRLAGLARRFLNGSTPLPDSLPPLLLCSDLLPDWSDAWLVVERERYRHLRLHALEALCYRLIESGRSREAVETALHAVSGDPLRETAHRALISALMAEGNHAEAARQYDSLRCLLRKELGVEPEFRLADLASQAI